MPNTNHFLLLFGLLIFGCSTPKLLSQKETSKPNVIFILTDDQGALDVGAYGTKDIQTPNIDRIARKGVRFTQFYANAPICSPSRAAILTGKSPINAGVPGNVASIANQQYGMPASEITIAEKLKENGYKTAAIGKWHLGYTTQLQPTGQGFDSHFGHLVGCIDNYSHFYYWHGPNRHDLYRNGEEIYRDGEYFPAMCYEEAASFLEENQNDPFFIYYAMNTPHYPYQGSKKWLDYYNEKKVPYPRNIYNAFTSTMDDYIGKLLDKVEALGLTDNTIIIFQSDHGHSTETRAHYGGGYAGPYKGAKGSLFEGGLRVPAIISWPKKIPQNEVRSQWAIASDWYPTILELCGIPAVTHSIDGISIIDIIKSEKAPEIRDTWHWNFSKQWSIRQGDWKLLFDPLDTTKKRNPAPNKPEDKLYLVNLKTDIGETTNLAEEFPEKVKELMALYKNRKSTLEN